MTPYHIRQLISRGENYDVELKTCADKIGTSVYHTVCAFLNRHGGHLLLGVADDGEITGVNKDAVARLRDDFITAINNASKINPPTSFPIEEFTLGGRVVLYAYVPPSSQVHKCGNRIYDRSGAADINITNSEQRVSNLYALKQNNYTENTVYPHIKPKDLRADLIERCRDIALANNKEHPWGKMSKLQFLRSARLLRKDAATGETGVSLAGVMLLGADEHILDVCPNHRTDLLARRVDTVRYDDRDFVETNLIESYDRILAFAQKHLPDPFYLEGDERRSLRHIIFREVASNILAHREYRGGFSARVIIERDKVVAENGSRPFSDGALNPKTTIPVPKNPIISAFFRQIRRADELGSGMRYLMKYGKEYGGEYPEFIEGDVFKTVVALPKTAAQEEDGAVIVTAAAADAPVSKSVLRLLKALRREEKRSDIMRKLGIKHRGHYVRNFQEPALDLGLIEMTIPDAPNDMNQKYRLTQKGKDLLNKSGSRG